LIGRIAIFDNRDLVDIIQEINTAKTLFFLGVFVLFSWTLSEIKTHY